MLEVANRIPPFYGKVSDIILTNFTDGLTDTTKMNQNATRAARDGSVALLNRLDAAPLARACDVALADELRHLHAQCQQLSQALRRAQDLHAALIGVEERRAQVYREKVSTRTLDGLTSLSSSLTRRFDVRLQNTASAPDRRATVGQPTERENPPPQLQQSCQREAPVDELEANVPVDIGEPIVGPTIPASSPVEETAPCTEFPQDADIFARASLCLERANILCAYPHPGLHIASIQSLSVELHSLHSSINHHPSYTIGERTTEAEWKRDLVTPVVLATTLLIQTLWRVRPKSQALVRILSNINKELKATRQPVLASIRKSERVDGLKTAILDAVTPCRLQTQMRSREASKALWFALACYPCGEGKQARARVSAVWGVYKNLFRAIKPQEATHGSKSDGKLAAAFLVLAIHVDIVARFAPTLADQMISGIQRMRTKFLPVAALFDRQISKLREAKATTAQAEVSLDLEKESRIIRQQLKAKV